MAKTWNIETLESIARRAHYIANQMIWLANNRNDVEKGDPKIGGHSSASSSALHILGTLHLLVKTGFDHIANKPHASPADHAYNYLLNLFLHTDQSRFDADSARQALFKLRSFSQNGEPVFQSYHSIYDPDCHNFFPSGTVGIPPVNAGYMALAYRFARQHNCHVPDAHFWAVMGDSEFREGSLWEALPDFAERELGNLTWIIDYNRQSLDGHRIVNEEIVKGTDGDRVEKSLTANGWEVIQVRHGRYREEAFKGPNGSELREVLEKGFSDYELQVLLQLKEPERIRDSLIDKSPKLKKSLDALPKLGVVQMVRDLGGHDFAVLHDALQRSKINKRVPTLVIAHTIKGWGLDMAASPGNHSSLPEESEMERLRSVQGIPHELVFDGFAQNTPEGKFLKDRGDSLYQDILAQHQIKTKNKKLFSQRQSELGSLPPTLEINLKMANYPHTQWMLGQLSAKLVRIANSPDPEVGVVSSSATANPNGSSLAGANSGTKAGGRVATQNSSEQNKRALTANERPFRLAGEMIVSMAPDVGTSTNLNPAMDGKIFSSAQIEDVETSMGIKDGKTPDLIPGEEVSDRYLRFEIVEGNVTSCLGSFGKLKDILGIPLIPLMTVYDFFIKRALDQHFYNLYWKSNFILVGTPSGVTLSPEGAQHGWKSDFQIPNQITWEPFYCQELDWILCESLRRHLMDDNEGRCGVHIRGVTRGVDQKEFLKCLKSQARFKQNWPATGNVHPEGFPIVGGVPESSLPAISDSEILEMVRKDVLNGGYFLLNYNNYMSYAPGDNVVHIFAMGSVATEALQASKALLKQGIYANVIVVTSPDLLVGTLGHQNQYYHLKQNLNINSNLFISENLLAQEMKLLAGRRIPIVSVHDGEVGLLDNLGSLVGVPQETLAVRKHSKCGRPKDVYRYHQIDAQAVQEACIRALNSVG